MRQGVLIDNWEFMGKRLADADADTQALFFKSFISGCLDWGDESLVTQQLAAINSLLSSQERYLLSVLGSEYET